MIIPISLNKEFKPGDYLILTKDYKTSYAIFTKGHEFEYVCKDDNWGHIIKDGDNILKRIDTLYFTLDISLEDAKEEAKDREDEFHFRRYMIDNCSNKDFGYSDREKYDACKIKKKERRTYDDSCSPCFECAKYVKLDSKSLKYIRRMKLKELDEKG